MPVILLMAEGLQPRSRTNWRHAVSDGILKERGKSLEEQFFAKRDAELLQELREQQRAENAGDLLASALGIDRQAVPQELIALGLDPAEVTAFSLVPLVVVGWADGQLDDKERTAVLVAASQVGVEADSASHQLLAGWLQDEPPSTLLTAWKSYATVLVQSLSPEACRELERDVVGRARGVAEAAGGRLGLGGKVSAREAEMLREIESVFERTSS